MPPAAHHRVLFEPISIGSKTLRNRFFNVAHGTAYGVLRPSTWASYRAVRAEGGWAAVSTEFSSVGPSSDESPLHSSDIWDGEDGRRHKAMVDAVHEHGALASIELHHGGAHAMRRLSREPALSPSGLAGELPPPAGPLGTPKVMTLEDIERVEQSFVDAAVRARDVGYDIVDVLAGYGYLFAQFLSAFHNHRTDKYGGSLENRARFWIETLGRVRDAVGADCAVASRMSIQTQGPWGHTLDESVELVRMADPLVDLWDLNVGSVLDWGSDISPSRVIPEGHNVELFTRVRSATQKPIVGVSRWTSPDLMAEVVRSGVIDLIGSARQSIADPFFPQKVYEGRIEDIRECMGINHCISSLDRGNMACAQNATAGEEYRRGWHPERFEPLERPDVSVLVVGAGPAGLEAAIGLARRGADMVHLVDSADQVGGHLRQVVDLPGLREWGRFIDHRKIQIDKLPNLQLIASTTLSAAEILEYGASHVVVATGARWLDTGLAPGTHTPLPGVDGLEWVFTPDQLLARGDRPVSGCRVTVYDAEGSYMGSGLSQLLADEGYKVSVVTPHAQVTAEGDLTLDGPAVRRSLHTSGVAMYRNVSLTEVGDGLLRGADEFEEPFLLETDALVLVTMRAPVDDVYRQLVSERNTLHESEIEAVLCIGDAQSPRPLAEAMFDGHRLAREFESTDPSVPLPYRRESLQFVK
ncbi:MULTISPECIES: FAD-dependent oxidoreductase [unclassified Nocardioides]|uniref:oxidoreductase n=1 Tax=unclassified Nocardioides TaxID=2615069 RepID=UPI00031609FA|nr:MULTISPECIES: FAD-dependent oxidoreductase [unclassified Nocardioides]